MPFMPMLARLSAEKARQHTVVVATTVAEARQNAKFQRQVVKPAGATRARSSTLILPTNSPTSSKMHQKQALTTISKKASVFL